MNTAVGRFRSARLATILVLGLATAPSVLAVGPMSIPPVLRAASLPPTFQAMTSFKVTARRHLITTSRQVTAEVEVHDLSGRLDVDLDRPFHARMGVKRCHFQVRMLDQSGALVERLSTTLEDGDQAFSLALRFPAPGRYTLRVAESDLDASPARLSLHPGGGIALEVFAGSGDRGAADVGSAGR